MWQTRGWEGHSVIRYLRTVALAALVLGASACASLPDTTGYTAATSELRIAVAAAGDAVHDEMVEAAETVQTAEVRESLRRDAATLETSWARTDAAASAMVDYAQSIEAITAAGNAAGDDVRQVANSLGQLASAAGIANPLIGQTGSLIVTGAAEIWQNIQNAQRADDLEETLEAASPAIEGIGENLSSQMRELERLYRAVMDGREILLQRYGNIPGSYAERTRLHQDKVAEYATAVSAGDEDREAALRREIVMLEAQREPMQKLFEQYEQERLQLIDRRSKGLETIGATTAALNSWREAHTRLVAAVRERRPISIQSLITSVERLRAVAARMEGENE